MKVAKLIMVSGDKNSNKYYHMFEQSNGMFNVEYGRVDSTKQTTSYPMSQWCKKYNEKVNKGYKDITELYAINEEVDHSETEESDFISNDTFVKTLIEDLQRWATNTVKSNYKVSTKSVTQKMVDEAQNVVNQISNSYNKNCSIEELNDLLLKLFTIIPRKMGNVKDYLISDNSSNDRIKGIIDNEQSLLDTMAGQVSMQEIKPIKNEDDSEVKKVNGILDAMGISVEHVTDANEIAMIKRMMGESSKLFSNAFKVRNYETEKRYNSIEKENETLLFHGSKNCNYFNILKTGLLIRPSGVATTGSMWGNGIYHSNVADKSIGYTSLYGSRWAGGDSNKAYLAIFSVNLGKIKHFYKHDYTCSSLSKSNIYPCNSVYAHAGQSLYRDEFITYEIERSTIKYLIEIKK